MNSLLLFLLCAKVAPKEVEAEEVSMIKEIINFIGENPFECFVVALVIIDVAMHVALYVLKHKQDTANDDDCVQIPTTVIVDDTPTASVEQVSSPEPQTTQLNYSCNRPQGGNLGSVKHGGSFATDEDNWTVVGASVIGKGHIASNLPCQDNNKYTSLGNGWGIAIVSDGAGSAENSQIGSKLVVERGTIQFEKLIKSMQWMSQEKLPSDAEWAQTSYSTLRAVYNDMCLFAEKKQLDIKSLSATAIVVIHSPYGILSAHIGDGRCGYRDENGNWKSLMTPHKGDEANQTVFITSPFWNSVSFKASGTLVPESVVIRKPVKGFVLMSDGCENGPWETSKFDAASNKVYDLNTPYAPFFNGITNTLLKYQNEGVSLSERAKSWNDFLDSGKPFATETDDKTMVIGLLA